GNFSSSNASVSLNPTVTTAYTVTGTSGGCIASKVLTVTVNNCTGINNADGITGIRLFPNPFSNELTLELQSPQTLTIYNISGKPVLEKKLAADSNTVDTSHLSAGVYTVRLNSEHGVKTARLVKIE